MKMERKYFCVRGRLGTNHVRHVMDMRKSNGAFPEDLKTTNFHGLICETFIPELSFINRFIWS